MYTMGISSYKFFNQSIRTKDTSLMKSSNHIVTTSSLVSSIKAKKFQITFYTTSTGTMAIFYGRAIVVINI